MSSIVENFDAKNALAQGYIEYNVVKDLKNSIEFLELQPEFVPTNPQFFSFLGHFLSFENRIEKALVLLSKVKNKNHLIGATIGGMLKSKKYNFKCLQLMTSKLIEHDFNCKFQGRIWNELFEKCKDDEQLQCIASLFDQHIKDWVPLPILEKMSLEDLKPLLTTSIRKELMFRKVFVSKAADSDELHLVNAVLEQLRLDQRVSPHVYPKVIEMFCRQGDGEKALSFFNDFIANAEVTTLHPMTFLLLIETLLKNGYSLKELGNIAASLAGHPDITLKFPYGPWKDSLLIEDHTAIISNLENEDKDSIDSCFSHLSGLGLNVMEAHVSFVLCKFGVTNAVELLKSYFNQETLKNKPSVFKIPAESSVLDEIVASENVTLLKEFLDI